MHEEWTVRKSSVLWQETQVIEFNEENKVVGKRERRSLLLVHYLFYVVLPLNRVQYSRPGFDIEKGWSGVPTHVTAKRLGVGQATLLSTLAWMVEENILEKKVFGYKNAYRWASKSRKEETEEPAEEALEKTAEAKVEAERLRVAREKQIRGVSWSAEEHLPTEEEWSWIDRGYTEEELRARKSMRFRNVMRVGTQRALETW